MSDVSKTNELIAEARRLHEGIPMGDGEPDLCQVCSPQRMPCEVMRLADALEAATRVPVQGEPQWMKDNRAARDLVKLAKANPATAQGEPNEPTEAQVEAAAKALYANKTGSERGFEHTLFRRTWLQSARIALVAAAGARLTAGQERDKS